MRRKNENVPLTCDLSVGAYTTVVAESLEAAIELAKDREVAVEPGDEDVEWVAREIQCETPVEIREIGQQRVPLEMPTIHIGGTGADRLFEDYANAAGAVRVALRELPDPSERDYHVRGPGSFARAMEDHQCRVAALQRVLDDLQAVLKSIADQTVNKMTEWDCSGSIGR